MASSSIGNYEPCKKQLIVLPEKGFCLKKKKEKKEQKSPSGVYMEKAIQSEILRLVSLLH